MRINPKLMHFELETKQECKEFSTFFKTVVVKGWGQIEKMPGYVDEWQALAQSQGLTQGMDQLIVTNVMLQRIALAVITFQEARIEKYKNRLGFSIEQRTFLHRAHSQPLPQASQNPQSCSAQVL